MRHTNPGGYIFVYEGAYQIDRIKTGVTVEGASPEVVLRPSGDPQSNYIMGEYLAWVKNLRVKDKYSWDHPVPWDQGHDHERYIPTFYNPTKTDKYLTGSTYTFSDWMDLITQFGPFPSRFLDASIWKTPGNIPKSLIPAADITYDLGTALAILLRWRNLFAYAAYLANIGPYSDDPAIMNFRTKNKAGTAILDHQFQPSDNEHGVLGCETQHWKEVHTKFVVSYYGAAEPHGDFHVKVEGEANPRARLTHEDVEFGPGGASAIDVYLKRIGTSTFELKARYLAPETDNLLEFGSPTKKVAKVYATSILLPSDGFLHITVYGEANPKARLVQDALTFGSGGASTPDTWLKRIGANQFETSGDLIPEADNARTLGTVLKQFKELNVVTLYVNGLGKVGWLSIADFIVITSERVLQNVTANAAIVTSGRFPLGRLPVGTSGYVLEAEGGGYDPMYVDPNGRYQPAGHNHAAGNITSGVLDEARCPNVYSGVIHFNGGIVTNSVNCANFSATDVSFENDFRITEAEKLGFEKGLAFLSDKGKLLMRLDARGNLHVRGKIIEDVKS
jgi:hypothetical protein